MTGALAPIPPVSRRSQYRERITVRDPRTAQLVPFDHATRVTVALYPVGDGGTRWDYGRPMSRGDDAPALSAASDDGTGRVRFSGPFAVEIAFPVEQIRGLCVGPYERSVCVTANGQADEVSRERVVFY